MPGSGPNREGSSDGSAKHASDLRHLPSDHGVPGGLAGRHAATPRGPARHGTGDSITLSTLHATVHLGAHADGANHFGKGAPGIEARPLEDFLGPCQVIRVACSAQVADRARGPRRRRSPRSGCSCRTGTLSRPEPVPRRLRRAGPRLVDYLHERGVRLVGIDTPSVDLFDSKDLPAHRDSSPTAWPSSRAWYSPTLPPGRYELIALPLRLVGFDASPVRAILRTLA